MTQTKAIQCNCTNKFLIQYCKDLARCKSICGDRFESSDNNGNSVSCKGFIAAEWGPVISLLKTRIDKESQEDFVVAQPQKRIVAEQKTRQTTPERDYYLEESGEQPDEEEEIEVTHKQVISKMTSMDKWKDSTLKAKFDLLKKFNNPITIDNVLIPDSPADCQPIVVRKYLDLSKNIMDLFFTEHPKYKKTYDLYMELYASIKEEEQAIEKIRREQVLAKANDQENLEEEDKEITTEYFEQVMDEKKRLFDKDLDDWKPLQEWILLLLYKEVGAIRNNYQGRVYKTHEDMMKYTNGNDSDNFYVLDTHEFHLNSFKNSTDHNKEIREIPDYVVHWMTILLETRKDNEEVPMLLKTVRGKDMDRKEYSRYLSTILNRKEANRKIRRMDANDSTSKEEIESIREIIKRAKKRQHGIDVMMTHYQTYDE